MESITFEQFEQARQAKEITPEVMQILDLAAAGKFAEQVAEVPPVEDPIGGENPLEDLLPTDNEEDELSRLRREKEEILLEKQRIADELERTKTLAEEIKNIKPETPSAKDRLDELKPEQFESEYEFVVAQQQLMRELIVELSANRAGDPNVAKAIQRVEEMENELATARKIRTEEQEAQRVRSEFEDMWSRYPDINPGVNYESASEGYASLVNDIESKLRIKGDGNTRSVVSRLCDPKTAESTRRMLIEKGVSIPEGINAIYETLMVSDFRDGYKFNTVTGKFDQILAPNGQRRVLATMDEAYALMFGERNRSREREQDISKLTEKRNYIEQTSQGVPSDRLAKIEADEMANYATRASILSEYQTNPSLFKKDPERRAQLEEVFRALNV